MAQEIVSLTVVRLAVSLVGNDDRKNIYQNEEYSIRAEVFCINAISDHCAVAIQFVGYNSYYVYYKPKLLSGYAW